MLSAQTIIEACSYSHCIIYSSLLIACFLSVGRKAWVIYTLLVGKQSQCPLFVRPQILTIIGELSDILYGLDSDPFQTMG